MIEYVYKINLPTLHEILLPGKYQEIFTESDTDFVLKPLDPKIYIKPEFLNFHTYTWLNSVLFYKGNGFRGAIHSDGNINWAVNYIVGGTGEMFYYDESVVGQPKIQTDSIGSVIPIYHVKNPPHSKRYVMPEGCYLVRTDAPHMVIGHEKRYALSLRATEQQRQIPWETIVHNLKDYIL